MRGAHFPGDRRAQPHGRRGARGHDLEDFRRPALLLQPARAFDGGRRGADRQRLCPRGVVETADGIRRRGAETSVPPQGGRKHPHQEFIQINTENILFICGGAFEGLDNLIKDRTGKKSIGFGTNLQENKKEDENEILKQLLPQDLLKFGLIPEFVGRLPIIATLKELDKQALLDIITKPKNSLVKQYKKLFEIDHVDLEFEDDALDAIVDKAIERKTGARGLRSILEEIMRDIMFEIPSNPKIEKCIITKDTIKKGGKPELIINENRNLEDIERPKRKSTNKKVETA